MWSFRSSRRRQVVSQLDLVDAAALDSPLQMAFARARGSPSAAHSRAPASQGRSGGAAGGDARHSGDGGAGSVRARWRTNTGALLAMQLAAKDRRRSLFRQSSALSTAARAVCEGATAGAGSARREAGGDRSRVEVELASPTPAMRGRPSGAGAAAGRADEDVEEASSSGAAEGSGGRMPGEERCEVKASELGETGAQGGEVFAGVGDGAFLASGTTFLIQSTKYNMVDLRQSFSARRLLALRWLVRFIPPIYLLLYFAPGDAAALLRLLFPVFSMGLVLLLYVVGNLCVSVLRRSLVSNYKLLLTVFWSFVNLVLDFTHPDEATRFPDLFWLWGVAMLLAMAVLWTQDSLYKRDHGVELNMAWAMLAVLSWNVIFNYLLVEYDADLFSFHGRVVMRTNVKRMISLQLLVLNWRVIMNAWSDKNCEYAFFFERDVSRSELVLVLQHQRMLRAAAVLPAREDSQRTDSGNLRPVDEEPDGTHMRR